MFSGSVPTRAHSTRRRGYDACCRPKSAAKLHDRRTASKTMHMATRWRVPLGRLTYLYAFVTFESQKLTSLLMITGAFSGSFLEIEVVYERQSLQRATTWSIAASL